MQHNEVPQVTKPEHISNQAPKHRAIKWFLMIPLLLLLFGGAVVCLRSKESSALAATTTANIAEPVSVNICSSAPPAETPYTFETDRKRD